MEIIIKPRQTGKTTELLNIIAQDNQACIFVYSSDEAHRLRRIIAEHYEDKISPEQIKVVNKDRLSGCPYPRVYVDNADCVLERLLGGSILGCTFTGGS